MPASRHQDHTTSPSAFRAFVSRTASGHRILHPTLVTIGQTPLLIGHRTRGNVPVICPTPQAMRLRQINATGKSPWAREMVSSGFLRAPPVKIRKPLAYALRLRTITKSDIRERAMPNREFLEGYPLYRPMKVLVAARLDLIEKPSINMSCGTCKSKQTFNVVNDYWENYPYSNVTTEQQIIRCLYRCEGCRQFGRTFFVRLGKGSLTKVGQFPAWDINGEPGIENRLGEHAEYYKRGLICESQGYGIGAFAYYRRIVEETIDGLLAEVSNLLSGDDKSKYEAALAQTKQTRQTSDKIDLVKDLLPAILRPENMNPLSALHEALSEGLHAESDEDCLAYAARIREILAFLTQQIAITTSAQKSFTASMRSLLEKRAVKKEG